MTDTVDHTDPRREPASDAWWADPRTDSLAGRQDRPVRVLEAATEAVADLAGTGWGCCPPEVLVSTVRAAERLRSVLDAVELSAIAELDATDAAKVDGWASAQDFVTAVSGGHKGSGRRVVALAHALAGDRAETGVDLAAGSISRTQAEVVVAAVDRMPVRPELRRAAERLLIDQARELDATDLTRTARQVVDRLDPDGTDRRDERALAREERAAHASRFLSIREDGIGGVRLAGRGTLEDAAWLKTVLFPLAAPQAGDPGACLGAGGPAGGSAARLGACGIADCAHDGRDPREAGARMWDALIEAARQLAGTEMLPDSHGATPRVVVTVEHDTLVRQVGQDDPTALAGNLVDFTGSLSIGAIRRLACDAEVLPVVLGSRSQILDVGRAQRLVTTALWQGLVVRDRHCAFPGCTRPPIACDAHHVRHWGDGGHTALDNLVLLCRTHHTLIHTTPWEVRLHPLDRRPEFLPPPGRHRGDRPLRRRPLRE